MGGGNVQSYASGIIIDGCGSRLGVSGEGGGEETIAVCCDCDGL